MRVPVPVLFLLMLSLWKPGVIHASEITASLSPEEIRPGDLFRLEVRRSSENYARFELEIPVIDRLHLIATESTPVEFANGRYTQAEAWIFQVDASGDLKIDGISVKVDGKSTDQTIHLPPLQLRVRPYSASDPDATPLDWPADQHGSSSTLTKLLLLLAVLLGAAILTIRFARKRRKSSQSRQDEPDMLAAVLLDLDAGRANAKSLYRFLETKAPDMSTELKTAIEHALYANRGSPQQIASLIRKELGS